MADNTTDSRMEDEGSRLRQVAVVYAEALLEVAQSRNQADEIGEELRSLVYEVLNKEPALADTLTSPVLKRNAKAPILENVFKGRVSETFYSFLQVLNNKNRLNLLRHVASAYRDLLDVKAKRVRVKVRSAVELTVEQAEQLRQTIGHALGREPILVPTIDPTILGGLIVQIGDEVYDNSVRSRIESIRNQLMSRSSHVASIR